MRYVCIAVVCLLLGFIAGGAMAAGRGADDAFYRQQIIPMALNVYHEARGEPELGQQMVAFITLKRAEANRGEWGGATIKGVVYKAKQFSWTLHSDKKSPKLPSGPAWDKAVAVATVVALGFFDPPAEAQGMVLARYYMNPDHSSQKNKCWMAQNLRQVAVVGNHYFYRELRHGESVTYVPPRFNCKA